MEALPETKTCEQCGEVFARKKWADGRKRWEKVRFCSKKCSSIKCGSFPASSWDWDSNTKICSFCGEVFVRRHSDRGSESFKDFGLRKFCGKDCQYRAQWKNPFDTYKEKKMAKTQPEGEVPGDDLTSEEKVQFTVLEEAISTNLRQIALSFVEVGKALEAIRDARLYREQHSNWETYLRDRWKMSKVTAIDYINAARTVIFIQSELPDHELPTTIAQALALWGMRNDPEALLSTYASQSEDDPKEALSAKTDAVVRREKWLRGEFGSNNPKVEITLDPMSAQWVAHYAEKRNLTVSEGAKRLLSQAVKAYAARMGAERDAGQKEAAD